MLGSQHSEVLQRFPSLSLIPGPQRLSYRWPEQMLRARTAHLGHRTCLTVMPSGRVRATPQVSPQPPEPNGPRAGLVGSAGCTHWVRRCGRAPGGGVSEWAALRGMCRVSPRSSRSAVGRGSRLFVLRKSRLGRSGAGTDYRRIKEGCVCENRTLRGANRRGPWPRTALVYLSLEWFRMRFFSLNVAGCVWDGATAGIGMRFMKILWLELCRAVSDWECCEGLWDSGADCECMRLRFCERVCNWAFMWLGFDRFVFLGPSLQTLDVSHSVCVLETTCLIVWRVCVLLVCSCRTEEVAIWMIGCDQEPHSPQLWRGKGILHLQGASTLLKDLVKKQIFLGNYFTFNHRFLMEKNANKHYFKNKISKEISA